MNKNHLPKIYAVWPYDITGSKLIKSVVAATQLQYTGDVIGEIQLC